MGAILACVLLLGAGAALAFAGFGWREVDAGEHAPWLSNGERVRAYEKTSTAFMSPTGKRTQRRLGPSAWRGEAPYGIGLRAARFLETRGILATWPESRRSGTTFDGTRSIRARVAPYDFTIVALQPTIVVMRFDLGGVAGLLPKPERWVQNALLENPLRLGTTLEGAGSLRWFSPELGQEPTPVRRVSDSEAVIDAGERTIPLRTTDRGWLVLAPR